MLKVVEYPEAKQFATVLNGRHFKNYAFEKYVSAKALAVGSNLIV